MVVIKIFEQDIIYTYLEQSKVTRQDMYRQNKIQSYFPHSVSRVSCVKSIFIAVLVTQIYTNSNRARMMYT